MRLASSVCVLGLLLFGATPQAMAVAPRDPFMFGSREGESGSGGGQLTGILWDAVNPLAVIDGEPLGVGASVGGWTVTAIAPDHVTIERPGGRETLTLGASMPSD